MNIYSVLFILIILNKAAFQIQIEKNTESTCE